MELKLGPFALGGCQLSLPETLSLTQFASVRHSMPAAACPDFVRRLMQYSTVQDSGLGRQWVPTPGLLKSAYMPSVNRFSARLHLYGCFGTRCQVRSLVCERGPSFSRKMTTLKDVLLNQTGWPSAQHWWHQTHARTENMLEQLELFGSSAFMKEGTLLCAACFFLPRSEATRALRYYTWCSSFAKVLA